MAVELLASGHRHQGCPCLTSYAAKLQRSHVCDEIIVAQPTKSATSHRTMPKKLLPFQATARPSSWNAKALYSNNDKPGGAGHELTDSRQAAREEVELGANIQSSVSLQGRHADGQGAEEGAPCLYRDTGIMWCGS